jgi:hypothetical protein
MPSQSSQQNQRLPWFTKVDLPPPLDRCGQHLSHQRLRGEVSVSQAHGLNRDPLGVASPADLL